MLVVCDASQLEWRILLLLSGDQVGIREIVEGQDVHGNNQKELKLPSRLIAKIFLFRTIFRGSGWAFAKDNDFRHISDDPKFWDERNEAFYRKYWEIDRCHQTWAMQVMKNHFMSGPSGATWEISPKEDGNIPWTQLTNYPVQGTAADLMSIARVSLRNRLRAGKLQSFLTSTVHDSLIVDGPASELDKVAELMYNTFYSLVPNMKKLWGIESPIPFPCEVKYGPNQGDLVKYGNDPH